MASRQSRSGSGCSLGELTKSRLLQANQGVEKYAAFREDIESAFRTDNRSLFCTVSCVSDPHDALGLPSAWAFFAAAIPLMIYGATVAEFVRVLHTPFYGR